MVFMMRKGEMWEEQVCGGGNQVTSSPLRGQQERRVQSLDERRESVGTPTLQVRHNREARWRWGPQ